MKKLIYSIFTAVALIFSIGTKASAQTDNTLFTYPQAPDELTTLYQRCNYLVDHFWDRCNYSTAFLNKKSSTMLSATGLALCRMPRPTPYTWP